MTTPADRIDTTQESKATKALVFGLLGFIPGWGILFAPFGWWLGRKELRLIKQGTRNPDGYTKANIARIAGMIATILQSVALIAAIVLTPWATQDAEQRAERQAQLQIELDEVVQNVEIPPGWEVEPIAQTIPDDVRGYKASPDLSNSGTWLLITVANVNGESEFQQSMDAIGQNSDGRLVLQTPTNQNGHDGHFYEVADMTGRKTGQPLGAYGAIYFGPDRTYEVLAQYEMQDKDLVGDIWLYSVLDLTLPESTP